MCDSGRAALLFPSLDLVLGFFLFIAIGLLERAQQLAAVAIDAVELVVRQQSPLALHFTAHLLPFSGQLILVHGDSPSLLSRCLADSRESAFSKTTAGEGRGSGRVRRLRMLSARGRRTYSR